MRKMLPVVLAGLIVGALVSATLGRRGVPARQTRDFSKEAARTAPAWVRDGVVYEIFPRNFSAAGYFNAVTAELD
ncbi:MAG: hypothetical protein ACRD68_09085, partial [Pyrinomonadaceae bacterium]